MNPLLYIYNTPSDPPDLKVSSTANSTVTAGDPHTIECNVTILMDYLVGEPAVVELSGPTGTILSRVTGLYLSHKLNSVSTSDTGLYTCRVIISVTSEGVLVTNVSTTKLTVLPQGEPSLHQMIVNTTLWLSQLHIYSPCSSVANCIHVYDDIVHISMPHLSVIVERASYTHST